MIRHDFIYIDRAEILGFSMAGWMLDVIMITRHASHIYSRRRGWPRAAAARHYYFSSLLSAGVLVGR